MRRRRGRKKDRRKKTRDYPDANPIRLATRGIMERELNQMENRKHGVNRGSPIEKGKYPGKSASRLRSWMQIKKKWGSLAKENQTPRLRIRDVVGQLQYSCAFVSFQFVYVLAYVSLHIRFLGGGVRCHLC